jgi:LisH
MAGLTTKQREELNLAIHEYLVKHHFVSAAEALAEEAKVGLANGSAAPLLKDILERKWSSVAKLKKEVDELTKQNKLLKEQSASGACERCGGGS